MKKIIAILLLVGLCSCEEIVNEPDITNRSVVLLAPANDALLDKENKVSFNWEYLNDATLYQLQLATPSFDQAAQIQLDTLVQVNQFVLDTLPANAYQWRVKAMNFAYETAYSTNSFTIE